MSVESRNGKLQVYKVLMICMCSVFLWAAAMAGTVYAVQRADGIGTDADIYVQSTDGIGTDTDIYVQGTDGIGTDTDIYVQGTGGIGTDADMYVQAADGIGTDADIYVQSTDGIRIGMDTHGERLLRKGRRANKPKHLQVTEIVMERPTFVATQYLQDMSLEEKIGQMIFLHYRGESTKTLKKYQFGGIILFADFFKGKRPEAVVNGIEELQETAQIPMLVGVDEEGGSVVRVSKYKALVSHKFLSPQELYAAGGMEQIVKDTGEKAKVLLEYGINVNLAPVADVSTKRSDYIYARTFGRSASETAKYVEAVVGEMSKNQIGSVLKHFPGYGNNRDTHKGFAVDKRSYDSFVKSDFLPFQAGIEAGADSVLVSHNIVNCMDEKLPASLSPKVHGILRGDMHFSGVVMTDDLAMDAISEADFGESPAVLAVKAGNDMIITTDYKRDVEDILQAVQDGKLSEKQIDKAVLRVLEWKLKLGILDEAAIAGFSYEDTSNVFLRKDE